MPTGALTSEIDVAQVALYVFWLFFAGLIFYLRREDRREGYPLETDTGGKQEDHGLFWVPGPKTYNLGDGRTVTIPTGRREPMDLPTKRVAVWPGAPMVPTGDPLVDGVGPASYPKRPDHPARMSHGELLLVPLRSDPGFWIESNDPDPRGMKVVGADGKEGGTVVDAWVDRSELILRYFEFEVTVDGSNRRVLLPVTFSDVHGRRRFIQVDSLLAQQFANIPGLAAPDQVTMQEEDRITAYYAGGMLYATPARAEPLI